MIPLSLRLRNCRSYRELDLDLPDGLLALVGPNGSGKSTIVNAIETALFGAEGRTLGALYPWGIGQEPMLIELMFEHAGEQYRVRRSYNPKGRGASKTDLDICASPVVVDDGHTLVRREWTWTPLTTESQKSTTEQIEALIGLSRETFRASVFLAQGDAGAFCEATAGARKQILSEVLGLGEWNEYLERARTEKRAAEAERDRLDGALASAEEAIAGRAAIVSDQDFLSNGRARVLAESESAAAEARQAAEALGEARAAQAATKAAESAARVAAASLANLEQGISTLEQELAVLGKRLEQRDALQAVADRLPDLEAHHERLRNAAERWQERQRLLEEHRALMRESEAEDAKATDLRASADHVLAHVGDAKCDRCEQTLGADAAERAAASYRAEAEKHALRVNTIEEHELPALNERIGALPAKEPDKAEIGRVADMVAASRGAREQLSGLAAAEERREVAATDLAGAQKRLPDLRAQAQDADLAMTKIGIAPSLTSAQQTADAANLRAREKAEHLAGIDEQVARLASRLEQIDKIAADALEGRARRDALTAEIELLIHLERACGPNGVPALILENVAIPQIEVEADRILGELGGIARSVELHTQRENKTGGVRETLDIVLHTDKGPAPYESLSGGERARVAFALRLSLAQLLASRAGSSTGLLVIDELEGLDAEGIAALVRVLEDLSTRIPKILLVSHNAEMRDAFPNSIMLENVDGVSRVVREGGAPGGHGTDGGAPDDGEAVRPVRHTAGAGLGDNAPAPGLPALSEQLSL